MTKLAVFDRSSIVKMAYLEKHLCNRPGKTRPSKVLFTLFGLAGIKFPCSVLFPLGQGVPPSWEAWWPSRVAALDSGSNGLGSSPGRGHCVVFLGKILYSNSASLHPGV